MDNPGLILWLNIAGEPFFFLIEGNQAKKEKENKSQAHVHAELVESLSPNHY